VPFRSLYHSECWEKRESTGLESRCAAHSMTIQVAVAVEYCGRPLGR
jgi:hypothetical protein